MAVKPKRFSSKEKSIKPVKYRLTLKMYKEAKNKDPLNTTFGCIALSSVFIFLFLNEVFKSAFVF